MEGRLFANTNVLYPKLGAQLSNIYCDVGKLGTLGGAFAAMEKTINDVGDQVSGLAAKLDSLLNDEALERYGRAKLGSHLNDTTALEAISKKLDANLGAISTMSLTTTKSFQTLTNSMQSRVARKLPAVEAQLVYLGDRVDDRSLTTLAATLRDNLHIVTESADKPSGVDARLTAVETKLGQFDIKRFTILPAKLDDHLMLERL